MGSIDSTFYPEASGNSMSYGHQSSTGGYDRDNLPPANFAAGWAQTAGQTFGEENGQSYSQGNGQGYGQGNGQSYGQSTGQSYSQNNGQSYGQNNGHSNGHSNGQSYGQSSTPSYGQSSTPSYGQNSTPSYSQNSTPSYSSGQNYSLSSSNQSSNQSYGQSNSLKQSSSIPTLKLNDGNEIPILAFGLGSAFHGGKSDEVRNSALTAIKNGFYHIDAAEVYGNEKELGAAIRQSGVPRSQLYITSKVWTVSSSVKAAFDGSLERLGVDYIDLYLINWPQIADKPDRLQQIWSEMEGIKQSGRARSIGVSNFLQEHLEMILRSARIPPAVNQIEYHTYLQHGGLVDFHRQHNIVTAAYSPLAPITKAHPGPVDNILATLARKYGVGEADIAIRWVLDQGIVAVTTSTSDERVQSLRRNLPTFKLTEGEIQEIAYQGKGKHFRGYFNDIYGADDKR
ncbi:NADP-dependent oxidoreductase domain-containing protein [Annulohypoxylon bovei var. microspora]|nr:NADP-dependent oxidoreductase domain-containing protein [Annulohypoxylon bovei var. microspora]